MEQYQYQPLPSPSSIRLIKLKPGETSDDISCSLVIADTLNPPAYIALSYFRGDTSNTVPLTCDGRVVEVTPNLQDALRPFRNIQGHLWADGLCIDQKNTAEQNQHANMMATIYSKAAAVTVWLGRDEHNDAPAIFEDIKALVEGIATIHASGGHFKHVDTVGDLHWVLGNGQPCLSALPGAIVDPDEEERARLERFFRLPWFSHIWKLQEVGLASETTVRWGGLGMQWHPIGVTAMFLLRHCRALLDKLALTADVENVYHMYTAFSPFIPMATFLHVIHNARRFKATDPRDKVYALLSHPTAHTVSITKRGLNWARFEPYLKLATHFLPSFQDQFAVKTFRRSYSPPSAPPLPLLLVDYNKTVEEVYHSLALDHINRTKSLEVLTAVQHDPENTSSLPAPSWVPRWDYFINTPVLGFYNSTHIASANKDAIVTAPPPDAKNALTVRGKLISRIVDHTDLLDSSSFDLSPPTTPTEESSSDFLQRLWRTNPIVQTWISKNVADLDPESYPNLPLFITGGYAKFNPEASSVFDAYVSTWVAGNGELEVDGFDLKVDSSAYWETLFCGTSWDPDNIVYKISTKTLQPISNTLEERTKMAEEDTVRWKRYRDSAARVCHKRKFFFTKKGFFGLGPGALRPGDFVAVLLGSDVPFLIREVPRTDDEEMRRDPNGPIPMDTKFQLVGECYVHGLMSGQAVRGQQIDRNITLI